MLNSSPVHYSLLQRCGQGTETNRQYKENTSRTIFRDSATKKAELMCGFKGTVARKKQK